MTGIVYADNRFVAVGTQGVVFTSLDGEEWKQSRSGITEDLTSVFHYHEDFYGEPGYRAFMAVGKSGAVYGSVKGDEWKRIIPPQPGVFHRIFRPAKDWFGTFQDSGVVLISNGADTIPESWHRIWTGTRNRLTASALGRGLLVAVGTGGAVVALPDSENFHNFRFALGNSSTRADLRAVAWGRDRYIAVGDSGTAVVSADGYGWKKEDAGYGGTLRGIAFGAGRFIAVADDRILAKRLGADPAPDSSAAFGDTWIGMWLTPENGTLRLARLDEEKRDTGYFPDPVTPPANDWMETVVPAWGNDAESFVPPGWGFMAQDTGDLNRDGRTDLAFVLEAEDEGLMNVGEKFDEPYLYSPRILGIAFGDSSGTGFRLVKRDDNFIRTREDPHIEEPFGGLTISEEGVLTIGFHFWTSLGSWSTYDDSYDFKFLDGDFTMVGAKSSGNMRNSLDSWDYTYDLIGKRKTIIKGNDSLDSDTEPTKTEDTLEVPEPIHFENFSDQWRGFE